MKSQSHRLRYTTEAFLASTLAIWIGCSSGSSKQESCPSGEVTCACYGNHTCNSGLACFSDICVVPKSVGNAGSAGTATCLAGSEACTCHEAGTCDGSLVCSANRCVQPSAGGATQGASGSSNANTGGLGNGGGGSPASTTSASAVKSFGGTRATSGVTTTGGALGGSAGTGETAPGGGTATGGTGGASTGSAIAGATSTSGHTIPTLADCSASKSVPQTGCSFVPLNAPSCHDSTLTCQGESCCTAIAMPGGTYPMGRSEVVDASDYYPQNSSSNELPEHDAIIAQFALDKYPVTVGRFRKFVEDYDAWHTTHPLTGEGANPNAIDTGWGESWTATSTDLQSTSAAMKSALSCMASYHTWSDPKGTDSTETYPITCVSWYQAFAFCVWDGGRLPTEAEWEYAAAGGAENRLYPWGSAEPTDDYATSNSTSVVGTRVVVGSHLATGGAGYFGHADLVGAVIEWLFDWQTFYPTSSGSPLTCDNCVNTTAGSLRAHRGGGLTVAPTWGFRAAYRQGGAPGSPGYGDGLRCARAWQ